jgi:hypothetical protein
MEVMENTRKHTGLLSSGPNFNLEPVVHDAYMPTTMLKYS